jgi:hypothetical protein
MQSELCLGLQSATLSVLQPAIWVACQISVIAGQGTSASPVRRLSFPSQLNSITFRVFCVLSPRHLAGAAVYNRPVIQSTFPEVAFPFDPFNVTPPVNSCAAALYHPAFASWTKPSPATSLHPGRAEVLLCPNLLSQKTSDSTGTMVGNNANPQSLEPRPFPFPSFPFRELCQRAMKPPDPGEVSQSLPAITQVDGKPIGLSVCPEPGWFRSGSWIPRWGIQSYAHRRPVRPPAYGL